MARETTKEIYIFEENGYFWLTDHYDLNRVRFPNEESRQAWIDGFEAATGKQPVVIKGKPNVIANLAQDAT